MGETRAWVTVIGLVVACAAGGIAAVFGWWVLIPVALAVLGIFVVAARPPDQRRDTDYLADML